MTAVLRAPELYRPPAPNPLSPVLSLLRVIWKRERSLLSLVPQEAYREMVMELGKTRRGILLINDPALVAEILTDANGIFPKNDLMVDAVEPLVGDSMFVSSGATWKRQRRMIEPAFSHMRINRAFTQMVAAVDDHEAWLDGLIARGETYSLDAAMGHLTADVITRTIFSVPLATQAARDVFDAFTIFERRVASVNIRALLLEKAWSKTRQPPVVLDACRRIRAHIGEMLDPRLAPGAPLADDLAGAAIAARDPETGATFSREELVDELGVFFLAGHETSASVLTWVLYILAMQPEVVARIRAEVDALCGDGPIEIEHAKRLPFTRNVFRETMRLYPPITFLPRVAAEDTTLGHRTVKRGTMLMIAPWTIHRHVKLWKDPDRFDPDRFTPEREGEMTPGAYLPFGVGPRVCVGAAFATLEASLIIARLAPLHEITFRATYRPR
jgi:cytochrome P450